MPAAEPRRKTRPLAMAACQTTADRAASRIRTETTSAATSSTPMRKCTHEIAGQAIRHFGLGFLTLLSAARFSDPRLQLVRRAVPVGVLHGALPRRTPSLPVLPRRLKTRREIRRRLHRLSRRNNPFRLCAERRASCTELASCRPLQVCGHLTTSSSMAAQAVWRTPFGRREFNRRPGARRPSRPW